MFFDEQTLIQLLRDGVDLTQSANTKPDHTLFMEFMDNPKTSTRHLQLIHDHYDHQKWITLIRFIKDGKGGIVSLLHRGTCEGLFFFLKHCGDISFFSDAIRGYIRKYNADVEKINIIRLESDYFERELPHRKKKTFDMWAEHGRHDILDMMNAPKPKTSPTPLPHNPPSIDTSSSVVMHEGQEIKIDLSMLREYALHTPSRWRLRMALDLLERWQALTSDSQIYMNPVHDQMLNLFKNLFANPRKMESKNIKKLQASMNTIMMEETGTEISTIWRPMYEVVGLWLDVLQ